MTLLKSYIKYFFHKFLNLKYLLFDLMYFKRQYFIDNKNNKFYGFYNVHIPKSYGTFFNLNFIKKISNQNPEKIYNKLTSTLGNTIYINNNKIIGWNLFQINKNNFTYAFSHKPFFKLKFSKKIFYFTVLRDPIKRIKSLYFESLSLYKKNIFHPGYKDINKIYEIDTSFSFFIKNIKYEHSNAISYMFSENKSPDGALKNLEKINLILTDKEFDNGLKIFNGKFKFFEFKNKKKRESEKIFLEINEEDMRYLNLIIKDDYSIYNRFI